MASTKRFKDVFEFVRRIKASSTCNTNSSLTVVPSVRNTGYGIGIYHYYTTARKGLQLITAAGSTSQKDPAKMMRDDDDGKKFTPPSPQSMFRRWGAWILGFFATFLLPIWKTRWKQVQKIEGEAEMVVEEIDKVAKVVEKVAVVAEKVSEELIEALPANSKLKKTALVVEKLSKVAAADAVTAENIIHQVEVLKHDFQELEKVVRPVVSKEDHSK